MANMKAPRYFVWSDGKPRWIPGAKARQYGFSTYSLRRTDADGFERWLPYEEATALADRINVLLDEAYAAGRRVTDFPACLDAPCAGTAGKTAAPGIAPQTAPMPPPRPDYTVADLYRDWQGHRSFMKNAPKTREDYKNKLKAFLAWAGDFAPAAVTPGLLSDWYEANFDRLFSIHAMEMRQHRDIATWRAAPKAQRERIRLARWEALDDGDAPGHYMANGVMAVVSALFAYGRLSDRLETNPALQQGLIHPRPDPSMIPHTFLARIVATADAMRFPSIGDAYILGIHLGQRLADTLALPAAMTGWEAITVTQSKTGAAVTIPFSNACKARLASITARRQQSGLHAVNSSLIRDEKTGLPYDRYTFIKRSKRVVTEAARIAQAEGESEEQAPHWVTFRHCRSTCVMRLADMDKGPEQIRAVTGHSANTVHYILRHYNKPTQQQARFAIDAMNGWLEREGAVW